MTYSVFAIDANALSPSGCAAYTYTLNGILPYIRAPFYQFSEQSVDDYATNGGTNPAYPFLTGHGGANQIVPFGYLGVRTDQSVLYISPSLPPQIPHVRVRDLFYAGAGLSASINATHTTITRFSTADIPAVVDAYANTTLPLILGSPDTPTSQTAHTLAINQTLILPNRIYSTTLTTAHNILQCLPVVSSDAYFPGQFPVAANDGATATRWQAATDSAASILINTTTVPFQRLTGAVFDWGARPPRNVSIFIGNETVAALGSEGLYGEEEVIFIGDVKPNEPFNADSEERVVPYVGNETSVVFGGEAWSGRYVRLVVEGCWAGDGVGATVAEFVLLGDK